MRVVVTGLALNNEAAFGVFMDRSMAGWSWQSAPAGRGAVLPPADILVADMVSLGLARWSEKNEADLFRVLQGRPAVLLLPSSDRSWDSMETSAAGPSLVWLHKPYGTREMKAALEQLTAFVPRELAATEIGPVDQAPDGGVGESFVPGERAVSAPEPVDEAQDWRVDEWQARLAILPEGQGHAFLRQLSTLLEQGRPFEVRFTVQNSLIVHPPDGWAATNTPMLVIKRICKSDALASVVSARELDGSEAERRVQRLGMAPQALDVFLHDIVNETLPF